MNNHPTNQFTNHLPVWYLAALLAANLALWLPPLSPLRVATALLWVGLLPGLAWSWYWFGASSMLFRLVVASAFSYIFATLTALWLQYLPGPVVLWHFLLVLNGVALLPLLPSLKKFRETPAVPSASTRIRAVLPLLFIMVTAILLRTTNLAYSEFQGDEALAMLSAAEALEGHEDALFLRAKGPGELLLPLAVWRLTGVINEPVARLPFTLASLGAIVTMYLIGARVGGLKVGWLTAGFFAFNGFMVAFGRIVQYQALVVWLSALAFLLMLHWRDDYRLRWPALAGLSLGTGLLAHYDAILVLPAIGWLLAARLFRGQAGPSSWLVTLKAGAVFVLTTLLAALPFYLPFFTNPQAGRTGEYVGGRIGTELRNNLSDFFHFNTFYSSFYFLVITGGLVLAAILWLGWRYSTWRWTAILAVMGGLVVMINPAGLVVNQVNLAIVPFALLLAAAFLSAGSGASDRQAIILWLAVPFLGYNFVVALGLTHIYTIVPAWSLLAAWGVWVLGRWLSWRSLATGMAMAALLQTVFLWNVFVQHDAPYRQDYPRHNPPLFWTPYNRAPQAGFFGFPHRAGWKSVGQKIADGTLVGDYGSNEEPDVTVWYTRAAPRACDDHPEFYFLADEVVDPVDVPDNIIATDYQPIAAASMQILQQKPATLNLGTLDDAALARAFDRSAWPAAFARSAVAGISHPANFDNLIQLRGYDADLHRLYPGGRLPVTLYWQALARVPTGYQVFVHLSGPAGPVAQADGVPVCWSFPTDRWQPGQIVTDPHAIALPPDLPPGEYRLEIGLYRPDTLERLNVLDVAGNPAGVSVVLTMVEIEDNQ